MNKKNRLVEKEYFRKYNDFSPKVSHITPGPPIYNNINNNAFIHVLPTAV